MADVKTEVTLKLVVIKGRNEVLFVEAGKDFVDALFSFLKLPLGTVARLVLKEPNVQPIEVASLSSLYQSVENLYIFYINISRKFIKNRVKVILMQVIVAKPTWK